MSQQRQSPELMTIQKNLSIITETIASGSHTRWFSRALSEEKLLSPLTAQHIVRGSGTCEAEKAGQLMKAVEVRIRSSGAPAEDFKTFIEILQGDSRLEDLAKQLSDEYSKF